MAIADLKKAQKEKNDEFYTQYSDIQKEINNYIDFDENVFRDKIILLPCDDPEWSNFTKFFAQNFERYGIKKLISTSYAIEKKNIPLQPSLFETEDPKYNADISKLKGKIFTLDRDTNKDGVIDINDLEWEYLEGDGDFRSKEVIKLRDEADIIITNPPFSLFREFIDWLNQSNKKFLIIGNVNAIIYKEIFPLIKENKLWLGPSISSGDREFGVPESYPLEASTFRIDEKGNKFIRVKGVRWFTNLEHGKRHEKLSLMTEEDNLKFNNKLIKKLQEYKAETYLTYKNYDAIEVPFTNAIPADYSGVMGVPITFLDKYNPEQFEILGMCENEDLYNLKTKLYSSEECKEAYFNKFGKKGTYDLNAGGVLLKNGILEKTYSRVLIKAK